MFLLFLLILTLFYGFLLFRSMAHVRKTMRPIDSSNTTNAVVDEVVSFEFGPTRVTLEEFDEFARCGWFSQDL
jgi:hypothetical protein